MAKFENLPPQNEDGTGYVHEDEDGLTWGYSAEELEYDKKFSWLMPVWYKFKDLDCTESRFIKYRGEISMAILHSGPSPSEACKLLAEGIRWYNSVKK